MTEQAYELVPLDRLTEHPENPRRGDTEAVVASIAANGWHGALVAQTSTGFVLAGNTRLRAARQLGMGEVPVLWRDVDDETARRILVADNRATDLGYFDEDALADLLQGADLDGTLFSEADLELLAAPLPPEPEHLTHGVQIKETPGQSTEAYEATGTRSIVVPLDLPTYIAVTDALRQLRAARQVATNAEVIAAVVLEAAEVPA